MKLIELGSNKASFNTVKFNPDGLNLIVGTHNDKSKSTYNGVGKSFCLYLIQFCLGSKANKKLEKKLEGWSFYLKFDINGKEYITERSINNQNLILLNGEELSCSPTNNEFGKKMLHLVFDVPEGLTKLSFRSLISRFLRTRKEDYLKFDKFLYKEQDERALLSNSFLLGLNAEFVEKKFLMKEEFNKINKLRKTIANDDIFKSFFEDFGDAGIRITELKESVEKLENTVSSFKIADDYQKIEEESNQLSYKLKSLSNEYYIIKESLENIEKSLNVRSDVSQDDLLGLLSNVEEELNLNLESRLNEVLKFHNNLVTGREARLKDERTRLRRDLGAKMTQIDDVKIAYDKSLSYLNEHGALADYVSINQKLSDDKATLDKLTTSVELIESYKSRETEIKATMAEDDVSTDVYLREQKESLLKSLMDFYRELTGNFYEEKKGGINVVNNTGNNKLRFEIEARIQDDSSDGINEVRIFCFDLMLLLLQYNHNSKFIFHDSRLFGNMDTHQRFVALNFAYGLESKGFQYIATINQDTIDALKLEHNEEYSKIIEPKIIMELNAESDSNRLLGVHIDLDYETK